MVAQDLPQGAPSPNHGLLDTKTASSEASSLCLPQRPVPLPLGPRETLDQTDAFPELPELPPLPSQALPRSARSLSLAQISGPVKRKPLSSTASPAAIRYSKGGSIAAVEGLPKPEQRFARSCSLDSPTLYEFPDHRSLLATSALSTLSWPASPDSSQP
jgi:hypothetical protein